MRVSVICTNVLLTLTEMKIVLDTNCLIMAISSRNKYHSIWKSFLAGKYVLCVTNEIIPFPHVDCIGIDAFTEMLRYESGNINI